MSTRLSSIADWSTPEPFDAREVFFMRHAAQIRAWAALEREVQEHAEEFLAGIARDLVRSGGLPGLTETDVMLECGLQRKYPMIQLRRISWMDGEVSVALQWRAGKVTFDGRRSPYVGVRVEGRWKDDDSRLKPLIERLSQHRSDCGGGVDLFWPSYRNVPIPSSLVHDDHIDLVGYRDHVLAEFLSEWLAVADILDATIREVEG